MEFFLIFKSEVPRYETASLCKESLLSAKVGIFSKLSCFSTLSSKESLYNLYFFLRQAIELIDEVVNLGF